MICINNCTVRLFVCVIVPPLNPDFLRDILSISNITEDLLSVSNTYANGATLPVSQLEQGGTLVLLKI